MASLHYTMRYRIPRVLLLALVLILALAPSAFAQTPTYDWVENSVAGHEVWDPDGSVLGWVPGQPKGYTEGETAAFRVQIGSPSTPVTATHQLKFQVCLDLDDSGAYAFTDIESWDTTYLQDGTHLTPPPAVGTLTGDVSGFNASNALIDYVTFLGEATPTNTTTRCPYNYQAWEVGFTVSSTGIA